MSENGPLRRYEFELYRQGQAELHAAQNQREVAQEERIAALERWRNEQEDDDEDEDRKRRPWNWKEIAAAVITAAGVIAAALLSAKN